MYIHDPNFTYNCKIKMMKNCMKRIVAEITISLEHTTKFFGPSKSHNRQTASISDMNLAK